MISHNEVNVWFLSERRSRLLVLVYHQIKGRYLLDQYLLKVSQAAVYMRVMTMFMSAGSCASVLFSETYLRIIHKFLRRTWLSSVAIRNGKLWARFASKMSMKTWRELGNYPCKYIFLDFNRLHRRHMRVEFVQSFWITHPSSTNVVIVENSCHLEFIRKLFG